MMTANDAPLVVPYELGRLGRADAELSVSADPDARTRIAQWAGVSAVESFAATVHLRKHSATRFVLDAELEASIVQDCVVTLEPVRSRIERAVHRELHLSEATRFKPQESVPLAPGAGDDEVPEEIDSLEYDVAAPLLEDFLLAIDPYPRAPGVEFATVADPTARPESPFAILKRLKTPP